MTPPFRRIAAAVSLAAAAIAGPQLAISATPATPTAADLATLVQAQAAKIAELEQRLAAVEGSSRQTTQRITLTEERLDLTGAALDNLADSSSVNLSTGDHASHGNASWAARTSVGGYGELHYNNLDADDSSRDSKEIDFHRFVLNVDHAFTDRISLHTELELEHSLAADTADGSSPGEVELEQAYIQMLLSDTLSAKSGLFLLPLGIINETHEPPTFYGVERNDVENIIIPTTWWEAGVGLSGHTSQGISWDLLVHSGLQMSTTGSSAFRVRSGRQKVAEASAEDLAVTAAVRWTGMPGVTLGTAIQYQSDASQMGGDGLEDALLWTAHASVQRGGFGLRALYGRWQFEGDAVKAAGVDDQDGFYIEPSYRWGLDNGQDLGVYSRYEALDGARSQDRFEQWEAGLNWWPISNVVFKFDLRDREHDEAADAGRDFTGFDLGVGYQF